MKVAIRDGESISTINASLARLSLRWRDAQLIVLLSSVRMLALWNRDQVSEQSIWRRSRHGFTVPMLAEPLGFELAVCMWVLSCGSETSDVCCLMTSSFQEEEQKKQMKFGQLSDNRERKGRTRRSGAMVRTTRKSAVERKVVTRERRTAFMRVRTEEVEGARD
jgi:hypothetical protein